jgi:phospholipid/cholesterol/gamma-HCH transport system substrate-binding protein
MKNSLETQLGIFVVLALFAALIVMEQVGGFDFFHRGITLNTHFNSVSDLKQGDAVKMAGVNVGRVQDIQLADGRVKVTLRLNKGVVVKTDSKASIRFTGLMGQNYVSLEFGSPDAAAAMDGAELVSTEPADLNTLMVKLDNAASGVENLTKSFTGDKIDNLLGPITDFLKQNSEPLHNTITNISSISGQIASGQGTVGRLIYSDELYDSALTTVTNLQDAATQAKGTIADAQDILSGIKAGKGTIGRLVTDDTLYNETTGSMTNLHQILIKINDGQGTIGKLINEPDFYKDAKLTLQKVDKATEGLEDQGPISVLGTAAGSLF